MNELERSPENALNEFKELLQELGLKPLALAEELHELGDYRPVQTIARSIQRMLNKETTLSGEMLAVTRLLAKQQRRKLRRAKYIEWKLLPDGDFEADVCDFTIRLVAQTRGRWRVDILHKGGYRHQWPAWQPGLSAAKAKAVDWLEDAEKFLDDLEPDSRPL